MKKQEFIQKIRTKYPMYESVDDESLYTKVIEKYPQYKAQIEPETSGFVSDSIQTFKDAGNAVKGGLYKAGQDVNRIKNGTVRNQASNGLLGRTADTLQKGVKTSQEASKAGFQGEQDTLRTAGQKVGVGMGTASNIFGDILGSAIKTVVPNKLETATKDLGTAIGNTNLGQRVKGEIGEAVEGYEHLKQTDPNAARDFAGFGGAFQFATDLIGVKGGTKAIPTAGRQFVKGADVIQQGTSKGVNLTKEQLQKGANKIGEKVEKGVDKAGSYAQDDARNSIYEAVNPTKKENKAIVSERAEQLLPYIEDNPLKNSLEKVKERIDTDMNDANTKRKTYEDTVGVKGNLNTAPIIEKLKTKYQEKVGDSFIDADQAKIAQDLIETLEGFGKIVKDADIIKIRRAFDKIEKKNKGFAVTANATDKGDIIGEANKFFREEIRLSNPEYAEVLQQYAKTRTLSDVIGDTIQRKTGQTGGGFIAAGFDNAMRFGGLGLGGIPGVIIGEGVVQASKALRSPNFKLTKAKKILKNKENSIKSSKDTGINKQKNNGNLDNRRSDNNILHSNKGRSDSGVGKTLVSGSREIKQGKGTLKPKVVNGKLVKAIKNDITNLLKNASPQNISGISTQIANKLGLDAKEVKKVILKYITKYGSKFKDHIDEIVNELIKNSN